MAIWIATLPISNLNEYTKPWTPPTGVSLLKYKDTIKTNISKDPKDLSDFLDLNVYKLKFNKPFVGDFFIPGIGMNSTMTVDAMEETLDVLEKLQIEANEYIYNNLLFSFYVQDTHYPFDKEEKRLTRNPLHPELMKELSENIRQYTRMYRRAQEQSKSNCSFGLFSLVLYSNALFKQKEKNN